MQIAYLSLYSSQNTGNKHVGLQKTVGRSLWREILFYLRAFRCCRLDHTKFNFLARYSYTGRPRPFN